MPVWTQTEIEKKQLNYEPHPLINSPNKRAGS